MNTDSTTCKSQARAFSTDEDSSSPGLCAGNVENTSHSRSTDVPRDHAPTDDHRAIVWFDIDNTLYPYASGVEQRKTEKLYGYLLSLGFNKSEADALRERYIQEYGLVLRGLLLHHKVDPVEFDEKTDLSVPVEEMIRPDPVLLKLLQDLDDSNVRIWAFTNAHLKYAERALRAMGIRDRFEGIVFGDYSDENNYYVKPEPQSFATALMKANIQDHSKCYFIDDKEENIRAAHELGWGNCAHLCYDDKHLSFVDSERTPLTSEYNEAGSGGLKGRKPISHIRSLDDIRKIWPEVFVPITDSKN